MLKDCKDCPHYVKVIQLGQTKFHHFCQFHQLPYVFVKNHGKFSECPSTRPSLIKKIEESEV